MFRSTIHKCYYYIYVRALSRLFSLCLVGKNHPIFRERDHPTALFVSAKKKQKKKTLSLSLSNDLHLPVAP
jgi:hypothetical protein